MRRSPIPAGHAKVPGKKPNAMGTRNIAPMIRQACISSQEAEIEAEGTCADVRGARARDHKDDGGADVRNQQRQRGSSGVSRTRQHIQQKCERGPRAR